MNFSLTSHYKILNLVKKRSEKNIETNKFITKDEYKNEMIIYVNYMLEQ